MKLSKKSTVAITVLLILALSTIGNTIFLASADIGGTGKYLGIVFEPADVRSSGCIVTATKENSGQIFQFNATDETGVATNGDPLSLIKVGAGKVKLEALADKDNGWVFSHFEIDGVETATGETVALYKPVKYGEVTAVFERQTYTITVNVVSEDSNDNVTTTVGTTLHTINADNSPYIITDVTAGETPVFDFEPETGNHVSVFKINDGFEPSALGYTFDPVNASQQITVYFSPDGQANIPDLASGVPISLGGDVSLNFSAITNGGTAIQYEIVLGGDLSGTSLILWNVTVNGVEFDNATIALPYTGNKPESVFTSNDLDALYCDVDGDGEVTNADVNAVAIALSTNGRTYGELAMYDVNRDGALTSADIQLVQDYRGTVLERLEFYFDETAGILYIYTGHFSIFRGR